ncbi:MAG TPA: PilZ domain-containing protein [Candidatus Sulfotelmatobacter sp.]|nr:PilZ domain-containing protein [Candidatus Sulfotelmatobacter sp.]
MSETGRVTNTTVSNRRRSQRVFLKVRVVARFRLLEREWIVDGDTVVVNAHGGTVYLSVAPLAPGDIITLTNPGTDQAETCRVVRIDALSSQSSGDRGFEVAFAFDRPSPHFWAIAFPPTDWIESVVEH